MNIPPFAHTPLRQLADFLQRGRRDGQYTRISYLYIILELLDVKLKNN